MSSQSPLSRVNVSYRTLDFRVGPWFTVVSIPSKSGQCFLHESMRFLEIDDVSLSQSPLSRVNVSYSSVISYCLSVSCFLSQSPLSRVNVSYIRSEKLTNFGLPPKIVSILSKSGQCFLQRKGDYPDEAIVEPPKIVSILSKSGQCFLL